MSENSSPFSVIIPAHNEEAVIGRCLEAMLAGAPADAMPEIIVAANGCKDRTVAIAREKAPMARVLDLPPGSKVIAMNEANRIAVTTPRFFLDADVQCSYAALAATAEVLRQPDVMAASPAIRMDVSRCDAWVRAYYRVWLTLPYITDRLVGSGLFGLSEEGLKIVGVIPPTFADDTYVRNCFTYEQRRNVAEDAAGEAVFFTVSPPRTIGDLIHIETRRQIGADHLRALDSMPEGKRINRPGNIWAAATKGASVLDVILYIAIKSIIILRHRWNVARGKTPVWVRDVNARQA